MGVDGKTRDQLAEEVAELRQWADIWRRIAQIFLTVGDEDMYADVLDVVLEVTESKYGVFGYISGDGDLVCPSMTRTIWDKCQMDDKTVVFPREMWGGIWGRALTEKKTLYSNGPFDVPEGHIAVEGSLAMAIVHGDQVIGLLQVANKPTDYDEGDVRVLQAIAGHIAPVLKARLERDDQERRHRQAVERSLESEARYGHLFEHLSDAAFLVRADTGIVVETNRQGEELLGRSRDEIVGMRQLDIHPADQREEYRRLFEEFVVAGIADEVAAEIVTKDGAIVPVRISASLMTVDGEHLALGLFRDVTSLQRAEQALRQSEDFTRAVMDHLPVGIAVNSVDPTVEFEYMNDSFPKHYRTTRQALADPDAFWDAVYEDPEFREVIKKRVLDDCATGDPERMVWADVPITRQGQPTTFVSAGNIPIPDKKLMISMVWDVTDRKRAEDERVSLERQVQHAQKLESLGVLAGGIAHDFNNLLAVVVGNADMALYDLSDLSPARASVEEIKKAGMRATRLTNQMLAYSGKGRFVVQAMQLNELVEEMGHLLEASISKKISLEYELAGGLPAIEADVAQMQQVVMNLITNAAEAIEDDKGSVIVSTGMMDADRTYLDGSHLADDLPEGPYVYLQVSDTGHGMDEQTQAKLFEPFFTTKFTGRGLGMAAVLGIVRGHKGAIRVDSEVGKGTTFRLLFPPSEETAPDLAPGDRGAGQERPSEGTVLVVDDEPAVRALAEKMLRKDGFDVLTAANGKEALAVFAEHADEVTAVLLDLTMPEMSGEEAFEKMHEIRQDVPVLLCSGYAEEDATGRFKGKGPAGFVHKPFELAEMIAKVRGVLSD